MPKEDSDNGSDNDTWVPENYSHRYSKYMELKYALEHSVNVATLHVAMRNPSGVRKNLRKFKLIDDYFDLSYVLGSFPSNLYRIVRAYSAFQSGGLMYEPYVIKEIRNRKGRVIYRGFPRFKRVAEKKYVNILRSVLQDVVKEGTARRISYLTNKFDVAGKTGTTNDWRDVYFTGFTTSFTMSIWFGRDSYQTLWKGAVGGSVAAPVWAEIALKMCSEYGCGRFVPSYEEVVKTYPQPSEIPGDGDKYLLSVNFLDNSFLINYIDLSESLNRDLSLSESM
jgi:penicillin-binding protein 1A